MNELSKRRHVQAEAFCLMRYEGARGRREWIWNSRDGITPFTVLSADGEAELTHGNWHLDRYEPLFIPPIGSRVFVDMTEEIARPLAVEYVDRHWAAPEYPMSAMFATKDAAVEKFVTSWVADWGGHSPHVAVVTETMHAQFKARAEAGRP